MTRLRELAARLLSRTFPRVRTANVVGGARVWIEDGGERCDCEVCRVHEDLAELGDAIAAARKEPS